MSLEGILKIEFLRNLFMQIQEQVSNISMFFVKHLFQKLDEK